MTTDTVYLSDERDLFLSGEATEGDTLSFQTDTQLIEHSLGGSPLTMINQKIQPICSSPLNAEQNQGWLSLFNRRQNLEEGRWEAPVGVQPWSMAFAEDNNLFIADANSPQLLHLTLNLEDISESSLTVIPSISVIQDIAYVAEDEYQHLFVATAYDQRIDIYDIQADEWKI